MDLICLGELLIDFVPAIQGQRLRDVPAFERAAGGAPANVACGFGRLGGRSGFIGKVGADEFGYYLDSTLRNCGVDTAHLLKSHRAATGLAFVSLKADGERDFLFYRDPAADMLLTPEEVPVDFIRRARFFHFGSVSMVSGPARNATLFGAKTACDCGRIVSFDPNLRPALWPSLDEARKSILEGLRWASILKVSGEELAFMTGKEQQEALDLLFDHHPRLKMIALTLGGEGCVLALRKCVIRIPGFHVEVQDTTGAGDGFWAGVLFCLNRRMQSDGTLDWSLPSGFWEETARFANAVGALVVAHRGAIPAMPDLETVERFLAERAISEPSR